MAFDRNNPVDRAALKAEVDNNPAHYDGALALNTPALLTLFNDPEQARTVANSIDRNVSGDNVLEACATSPTEYAVVVDTPLRTLFITALVQRGSENIPLQFKNELLGVFSNAQAPTIRAAIIAEATGLQSQVEIMFGDDSVISRQDWFAARDSV